MATSRWNAVLYHLRRAVRLHDEATATDAQMLSRFIESQDEAAFEVLVRRHGPMVLGVCRRLLRNLHDAEDAFQAVFLVLVRKATSIAPRALVGNWLYGVAYQTALKARATANRRQQREKQVLEMPEPEAPPTEACRDLWPLLDNELRRLPNKYRAPIVLCDLEGKTRKEAAQLLGWPEGTLSGRLSRARELLAKRLMRRGLTLSASALALALAEQAARACLAEPLLASTVKAAALLAAGKVADVATAGALALSESVVKAMLLTKLKIVGVLVLVAACAGVGAGLLTHGLQATAFHGAGQAGPPKTEKEQKPERPEARADDPKTTQESELKSLAKARVEVTKKAYEMTAAKFGEVQRVGANVQTLVVKPQDVYLASMQLLNAQLDLSSEKKERIAAREEHLKRMKGLEEKVKKLVPDFLAEFEGLTVEGHRLEAEYGLAKEKSK